MERLREAAYFPDLEGRVAEQVLACSRCFPAASTAKGTLHYQVTHKNPPDGPVYEARDEEGAWRGPWRPKEYPYQGDPDKVLLQPATDQEDLTIVRTIHEIRLAKKPRNRRRRRAKAAPAPPPGGGGNGAPLLPPANTKPRHPPPGGRCTCAHRPPAPLQEVNATNQPPHPQPSHPVTKPTMPPIAYPSDPENLPP